MSKRLKEIPDTCPIYNKINDIVKNINNQLQELLRYADEIRCTAGDLRDTASDIAEAKEDDLYTLEKVNCQIIDDLEIKLYEANKRIEELEKEMTDGTNTISR
jgi:predicted RNase H-like nuclease (RuvC/YqgF family)